MRFLNNMVNEIMFVINLFGICLLLMIPIFNIWYASIIFERDLLKQTRKFW